MKWLPIEIVNYIFEYTDSGLYLTYCNKTNQHLFKIDTDHTKFKLLHNMYKGIEIFNPLQNSTQIFYNIPLKKIPSITKRLSDINSIDNYMSITVTEKADDIETDYSISTIITKKCSSLLLI
uniref:F-box domain-containing protein n=1 Tax=viral metagenome TaxID=1070528 RepID=A0A6C0CP63_9ZZZZ